MRCVETDLKSLMVWTSTNWTAVQSPANLFAKTKPVICLSKACVCDAICVCVCVCFRVFQNHSKAPICLRRTVWQPLVFTATVGVSVVAKDHLPAARVFSSLFRSVSPPGQRNLVCMWGRASAEPTMANVLQDIVNNIVSMKECITVVPSPSLPVLTHWVMIGKWLFCNPVLLCQLGDETFLMHHNLGKL